MANCGKIIGRNLYLSDIDNGELRHEIDFSSVYAAILQNKLGFDASEIGIQNKTLEELF